MASDKKSAFEHYGVKGCLRFFLAPANVSIYLYLYIYLYIYTYTYIYIQVIFWNEFK